VRGTVDNRSGQIELAATSQFREQDGVEPFPHAGPLPAGQPPPARDTRTAAHLAREHPPRDPAAQHEQDARKDRPIRDRLSSGVPPIPSATFGKQWFDPTPEVVIDEGWAHA
jgi:hypothetical protein